MNIVVILAIVVAASAITLASISCYTKRETSSNMTYSLSAERYANLSERLMDPEPILSQLEQGHKINAIKLYREQTGAGLKEAKDAVERLQAELRGSSVSVSPRQGMLDTDELHRLIRAKQKIHAIKYYREMTGVGLKEAKDAVDWLEVQMQQQM